MTTSKTIAALLGPTLMAGAASVFINLNEWPALVDQGFHDPALVFMTGFPVFVAGLAIVYFHNRWTRTWTVAVTVLGWLALAGGLSRILLPTRLAGIATSAAQTIGVMPIVALVIFAVGAFLSFQAYRTA